MSWIEQIKRDYTITTGDGAKYTVLWLNATRSVEYNIAEFNFIGVNGTLVKRSQPMGTKYAIEIYIQGENNLDRSAAFKKSSENPKAWNVSHPMYGALFVQPISLNFDDTQYNVTKITGQIMETIGAARVATNINPIDVIKAKQLATDATLSLSYVTNVPLPAVEDIIAMKENTSFLNTAQTAFATTTEDAALVTNYYNDANAKIDNAISDSFAAINSIQNLINLPATFSNTIFNRVKFLINAAQNLYANVTDLHVPNLKRLYENQIASILGAACNASVVNPSPLDYSNRGNVIAVIDLIVTGYNSYIANLDEIQTERGDTPDSYIPDFNGIQSLSDLVKYTVANLFSIADGAKQQRTVTTSTDTNCIFLAYKLYGLLPDDSTIDQLIDDNDLSFNELIQIKKGREIIYFV